MGGLGGGSNNEFRTRALGCGFRLAEDQPLDMSGRNPLVEAFGPNLRLGVNRASGRILLQFLRRNRAELLPVHHVIPSLFFFRHRMNSVRCSVRANALVLRA